MNWNHQYASINGIRVHYVDQGQGMPVILCHGFPHLWFSWHRQITALAAAGYRVIAPDMRGMGQTDAPQDPRYYDIDHITGDLIGLLDHLQLEQSVFAGLDFGAFAIYDLALRHPERVMAVIGLENPAAPHNPQESPLTEYRRMGEQHFLHIEYFREPPRADEELAAQPRRFLHKVFYTLSGSAAQRTILTVLNILLRLLISMPWKSLRPCPGPGCPSKSWIILLKSTPAVALQEV